MDGLSELFCDPQTANLAFKPSPANAGSPARASLPLRQSGPVPGRSPSVAAPTDRKIGESRQPTDSKKLRLTGRGLTALDSLEKDIVAVIEQLRGSTDTSHELILIVDQPDFLLAASGPSMGIGATEIGEWLMGLQQVKALNQLDQIAGILKAYCTECPCNAIDSCG